jgi:bifunctional DNase/RNase
MNCQWADCNRPSMASGSFVHLRKRRDFIFLCDQHTIDFQEHCLSRPYQEQFDEPISGFALFNVCIVVHGAHSTMLWIRDVQSARAIGFMTGPAEGYLLQARLGISTPPIDTSQSALVRTIDILGGRIRNLVVSDYSMTPGYLVLHCALEIDKDGKRYTIEIKASDAFAIALECSAQLLVREKLLEVMPRFVDGGTGGLWTPAS